MSLSWTLGRPWKREKERYFCGKCVEECGIIGILENGNALACGGKKEVKEKENGKEIEMRRYFL